MGVGAGEDLLLMSNALGAATETAELGVAMEDVADVLLAASAAAFWPEKGAAVRLKDGADADGAFNEVALETEVPEADCVLSEEPMAEPAPACPTKSKTALTAAWLTAALGVDSGVPDVGWAAFSWMPSTVAVRDWRAPVGVARSPNETDFLTPRS